MGLVYRKSVPLSKSLRLGVSTGGLSLSARAGRLTSNTRSGVRFNFGHGLTWRS